jgi:hypothetical protein
MTFSEDVVKDAWELVEGKCECSRSSHQHAEGRCNRHLILESRGKVGWGGWEACPIDGIDAAADPDILKPSIFESFRFIHFNRILHRYERDYSGVKTVLKSVTYIIVRKKRGVFCSPSFNLIVETHVFRH